MSNIITEDLKEYIKENGLDSIKGLQCYDIDTEELCTIICDKKLFDYKMETIMDTLDFLNLGNIGDFNKYRGYLFLYADRTIRPMIESIINRYEVNIEEVI